MTIKYRVPTASQLRTWPLLWLLLLLASALTGRAQSGPYGNEWIVQGQPYYKIKIWRDGLYRLDYAYLSQLGAGAVAPTQLQVWRRGKEVAAYQGGNSAALDATTFLEFYGQRNDGALDKDYYLDSRHQANPNYSYFTDTASYFITWGSRLGKRMAQPTADGGTPHAWRLQTALKQHVDSYLDAPEITYQPWLEAGEGFFSGFRYNSPGTSVNDSLLRAVATTATTLPRAEIVVSGSSSNQSTTKSSTPILTHHITEGVVPPGGSYRELGRVQFNDYDFSRASYQLQFSDIAPNGTVQLSADVYLQPNFAVSRLDFWRYAYTRLTVPQQVVWFSDRRSVFFQNDSLLAGPATYDVPAVPATVAGFDVHDPWNVQRIAPSPAAGAGALRYVFPSATAAQTRRLLLADESRPLVPAPARRVNFRAIDPTTANFIVITHPALQKASGTAPNAARAYLSYRASAAGGRYDTLMVTAPLLYDQFHYGERSVLALRHFALWAAAKAPAAPNKYLLLLGKGIMPGSLVNNDPNYTADDNIAFFGVSAYSTTRMQGDLGLDLVPVSTRAVSDAFLSSDWPHGDYTPRFITGRVVASTPTEVMNYLGKLQEYEAKIDPNAPNPEAWHKNVLNLAGGESQGDFAEFRGYLDSYKAQMEKPLFGASVTSLRRTTVDGGPVQLNISAQVNAGLQIINYFGHGSPNYQDIQIGDIKDQLSGYNNAGRYPVMIYNGCAVGSCFFNGPTFGSDWLLAANKGSVGLLAETGLSYAYYINLQQHLTNTLLFNTAAWFGRPVAEVQRETDRQLQTMPTFMQPDNAVEHNRAVAQLQSSIWHGDPALRLFAPAKPDLVASNTTLAIAPLAGQPAVSATSGSFVLNVGVSNPARITRDLVEIRITRKYSTGSAVYVYNGLDNNQAFPQAFRRDTTYAITLPQIDGAIGDNTFTVELDYQNKIAELDEANNTATLHYSFLRPSLTLLTPREFALVPTNTPRLVAQSNNPNEPLRSYDVQIDSVSTFNSGGGLQSFTQSANSVLSLTPKPLVAAHDSTVWYWRVRFTSPGPGEDDSWVTGSFRVVAGATAGGWSQSHNGQFTRDQLSGVAVAAPSNHWSFEPTGQPVRLRAVGGGLPGSRPTFEAGGGTIQTDVSVAPIITECGTQAPGLLAVVLSQRTLRRVAVPGSGYLQCGTGSQTFYYFGSNPGDTLSNINNSQNYRDLLSKFLDNVADGDYVLLVSQNRVRFADPNLAGLRQKLAAVLGSKLVSTLRNGDPWALVARKQAGGGQLVAELGPDSDNGAAYGQTITLNATVTRPGGAGQVVSTLIGPARQWQSLFSQIQNPNSTGSYTLSLIGVDASSQEKVLNADIKAKRLDLSAYSAATYPYMKLQLTLRDSVTQVPPQLRQWLLSYQGLPEGVVRRDLVNPVAYDAATLVKQAATGVLSFPLRFENVAPDPFTKRLQVQVSLHDANDNLVLNPSTKKPVQVLVSAPRILGAPDSVLTVPASVLKLPVVGIFGTFTPVAVINPQGLPLDAQGQPQTQPEQYYFNNELRLPTITIADTNVPPTLDVAVDGRHILNGELVSPAPTITIQLRDEDRLRHIKDVSAFTVYLQREGQGTATLVTDPNLLRFSVDSTSQAGSVAKLEYYPGKTTLLGNGTYTLRVQGQDPSKANASAQFYTVKFTVVNESTITNVFPYPNPVTSKAKFVFTVTGQELPRDMKIQIMTLTGRVVREIFMAELGPLHIGNNITDYAWDGTDQYGDRLANGTYLYRVLLDEPAGKYKANPTAGDRSFKNDWGKLVLLR